MTKSEMILLSVYILCKGEKRIVKYEDVIVHTFELFPDKFHLPGYPKYPDTESISKKLYDVLRPKGYLRTAKREYELTNLGLEVGETLLSRFEGKRGLDRKSRISPQEMTEYDRLVKLGGFQLFLKDKDSNPLDVDIYDFYKISVRTNKREVMGRLNIIAELLNKAASLRLEYVEEMIEYKEKLDRLFKEVTASENRR